MADLITAFVILLIGGCGAEAVRATCRRRLITPMTPRHAAGFPADKPPG